MSFVSSLKPSALSLPVPCRKVPGYDARPDAEDDDKKSYASAHNPAAAPFFVLFL